MVEKDGTYKQDDGRLIEHQAKIRQFLQSRSGDTDTVKVNKTKDKTSDK